MLGLSKAWYGNYNGAVTELGGSAIGSKVLTYTNSTSFGGTYYMIVDDLSMLSEFAMLKLVFVANGTALSTYNGAAYMEIKTSSSTIGSIYPSTAGTKVSQTNIFDNVTITLWYIRKTNDVFNVVNDSNTSHVISCDNAHNLQYYGGSGNGTVIVTCTIVGLIF